MGVGGHTGTRPEAASEYGKIQVQDLVPQFQGPSQPSVEADINALSELLYFVKDLADSAAEGGKVGGRKGEEE